MKALYKNLLERDELKHKEVMKAVEEGRGKGDKDDEQEKEAKKGKSEAELAKEKGAVINEEGQVVDKRQLLSAGLNAASTPKPKPKAPPDPRSKGSGPEGGGRGGRASARERETRNFEEQLLGKHGLDDDGSDDDEADRASNSRKLEDELLGFGSP